MYKNIKQNDKLKQFFDNVKQLKSVDKNLIRYPLYFSVSVLFLFVLLSLVAKANPIISTMFCVFSFLLSFVSAFSWRIKVASYKYMENVPGGSIYILEMLNRKFRNSIAIDKAVRFDRSGRIVHRAIGTFGVVFLIEGRKNGSDTLVNPEVKKAKSFNSSITVNLYYLEEYKNGNSEKIYKKIKKLKKSIDGKEVKNAVEGIRSLR